MGRVKPVSKDKLAEYCKANGIRWLASHEAESTRRHFPGVDLFLLVEFNEDHRVGLLTLSKIQRELSSLFGDVNTDLRTLPELRDHYREEVLREAEVQFAA